MLNRRQLSLRLAFASAFWLLLASFARCQESAPPGPRTDVSALAETVHQLQVQVQMLNSQVGELRSAQQREAELNAQLREELQRARQEQAPNFVLARDRNSAPAVPTSVESTASQANQSAIPSEESIAARVARLEDTQALMDSHMQEQAQTKVESGSKYRVRLSGIVLFNTNITRGAVDNLDIPQMAFPSLPGDSGAFSGSLRQSQISVEAFGPDLAGAHTSANVSFDFAGGFPNAANGVAFGIMRLRTGTVHFDWANTSVVAGQDSLFFAPLTPTTLSSLAIPALSYTGNLWSWTPQIRVEHRIPVSDNSSFVLQGGILDSLTGDVSAPNYRYPTGGEDSGQPSYAGHLAWTRRTSDRNVSIGVGGIYIPQNWDFSRKVEGWAALTDVTVPLGHLFELSGEFYRGRALGGFGGGVGQSLLLSGPIASANTVVRGLDSMGGWAQLKFKPTTKFEVNFAYGLDNPFASQLRSWPASTYYYGGPLISRNQSPFVNFIYHVRSDLLMSMEYRHLRTDALDSGTTTANQIGLSLGYMF